MIIGLHGRKNSGKDTAYEIIKSIVSTTKRISFADKLKESAAKLFDIDPELWDDLKNDPKAKVLLTIVDGGPAISSITAREFLQRYGTESHRDVFGADFWVEAVFNDPEFFNDRYTYYIASDVRFENEAKAIKHQSQPDNLSEIWLIDRPSSIDGDQHSSEVLLDDMWIDRVIDNSGTIEQFTINIYRALLESQATQMANLRTYILTTNP